MGLYIPASTISYTIQNPLMKILHVTSYHLSCSIGGTEIYIDNLCKALKKHNIRNEILLLNDHCNCNIQEVEYLHHLDKKECASELTLKKSIRALFNSIYPDILFIHTSASSCEGCVAEIAEEFKIPYFYFFHAQCWLCYQGNLEYRNQKPCRQMFNPLRCAFCMTSKKSCLLGFIKVYGGEFARFFGFRDSSWLNSLQKELKYKETLIKKAKKIICFNHKDKILFRENGIPEERLTVIPQGLDESRLQACLEQANHPRTGNIRFGYIGRCIKIKGCHILVKAALQISRDKSFHLDIYGCDWQDTYCREIMTMAKDDERISFYPKLSGDDIIEKYKELDILCIPSIVFETGPLTLLEGVYSGCLVVGSDQVGQKDFLLKYGILQTPNTATSWYHFFDKCIFYKEKIRNRTPIKFQNYRSMNNVADQLLQEISW